MSSNVTGRLPSLDDLESYALEQWEVPSSPLYLSNVLSSKYVHEHWILFCVLNHMGLDQSPSNFLNS